MEKRSIEALAAVARSTRVGAAHVAFVLAGLSAGGAERVISLITSNWVARGRTVTIITFDEEDAPIFHRLDPRIRIVRLGVKPGGGGKLAGLRAITRRYLALRGALGVLRPDVTISFLTKINVLTLLASLGTGRRVIVSERNNPRLQRASRAWTLMLGLLHWRANGIVMQTRASLECLGRRARRRAWVIPNPISVDPVPDPTRTSLTLSATGRLAWQKGFDMLIDAFALIADDHPDWTLRIWGEGECRADLEQMTKSRWLKTRIQFPGNSRSPDIWTGQSDAFVLSSRFEGFANALGEAMAAGLPVVAFDCGYGPAEMIENEMNGIIVPDGDVIALSAALDRVLRDADLRDRLGKAARAVSERFHPQVIVERWDAMLEAVAAE